jgi:hypothetical protein
MVMRCKSHSGMRVMEHTNQGRVHALLRAVRARAAEKEKEEEAVKGSRAFMELSSTVCSSWMLEESARNGEEVGEDGRDVIATDRERKVWVGANEGG